VAWFNLENKSLDQATSKVSPVGMFVCLVDFSRGFYTVDVEKPVPELIITTPFGELNLTIYLSKSAKLEVENFLSEKLSCVELTLPEWAMRQLFDFLKKHYVERL
jgi:hypothetical protein